MLRHPRPSLLFSAKRDYLCSLRRCSHTDITAIAGGVQINNAIRNLYINETAFCTSCFEFIVSNFGKGIVVEFNCKRGKAGALERKVKPDLCSYF